MSSDSNRQPVLRFGVFEVDQRSGELRKAGVRVALQEQPLRLLLHLLERAGDVVTRDELQRQLWPKDTFVDFEHGLNVAIKRLRDALGDDADAPRFVETLPRRGYRFIAPLAPHDPRDEQAPGEVDRSAQPLGRRHRPLSWMVAVTTIALAAVGTMALVFGRKALPLTNRDTILVADFVNSTTDAVFDSTLRQGLTIQLEQSPFLSVISRERIAETLRQMTRPAEDRVVGSVAREACQRVGAKVTVNGSIAAHGQRYVIGLEAVDCLSGETVANEQAEASGREKVLAALGSSASNLRRRLGESLASIQTFGTPLEQATTPSLDALKAFSIGMDILWRSGNKRDAASFLERAIELDSDFAIAYARLSSLTNGLGRRDDAIRYARAAHARRNRATESDRFFIDGRYCDVTDDAAFRHDCFMKVYELWKRTYPRDWLPFANLAAIYGGLGQYTDALDNGLEAMRLNPDNGFVYMTVVDAYLGLNRFAEARRITEIALARHLFDEFMSEQRFGLAFIAGDEAAMAAERQAVAGTPDEGWGVFVDSQAAAFHGRLKQARLLRERAVQLSAGQPVRLIIASRGAMLDAAAGLPRPLWDIPEPADVPAHVRYYRALAPLLSGDVQDVSATREKVMALPDGPLAAPTRVLLAVKTGDAGAIDRLPVGTARELGQPTGYLLPYLRGLAYLRGDDGPRAAAEFQRIIDHRGVDPTSPLYALSYVQQGRAYALAGKTADARRAYEQFLELWKDADPDVPILRDAKREGAALGLGR